MRKPMARLVEMPLGVCMALLRLYKSFGDIKGRVIGLTQQQQQQQQKKKKAQQKI